MAKNWLAHRSFILLGFGTCSLLYIHGFDIYESRNAIYENIDATDDMIRDNTNDDVIRDNDNNDILGRISSSILGRVSSSITESSTESLNNSFISMILTVLCITFFTCHL